MSGLKRFLRPLLAMVSGVSLCVAYPNPKQELDWMVWLWLLPLLFALWWGKPPTNSKPWKRGFGLGYLAGLSFFIPNLFWVRHSSRVIHGAVDHQWMGIGPEALGLAAVLGLSAYVSLYWGLWGALAATIGRPRLEDQPQDERIQWASLSIGSVRSAAVCAAAWVACEWLRSVVFTGFGWNGLGVALRHHLAMIQSAEFVGVIGLSFLPVFVGCVGYNTILRFKIESRHRGARPHLDFFVAAFVVVVNFLYGVHVLSREGVSKSSGADVVKIKTLLVQQNVPQVVRWSGKYNEAIYQELGELTEYGVIASRPDLVIWPESSLPYLFHDPNHVEFLNSLFKQHGYALLAGTDIHLPGEGTYNGAALMDGGYENHQLYRKIHLVPFGEYLPLRFVPGVEALLGSVLPGDFASGTSTEPLMLSKPAGVQVIPLICFEDTVGRLARKFARHAPQLLVNMTNDGWFLQSRQNEVHLANAMFRCVELRRPMARACNTGVTCYVDAYGRIARSDRLHDPKTGSVFIKGFLPKEITLEKKPPMTFYALYGDVFSLAMLILTVVLCLGYWLQNRSLAKLKGSS